MSALRPALWVVSASLLGLMAFAVAGRIAYPFELEWMEGATVVHVARLVAGRAVYVSPSIEFVPFAYPPLFYWVSALPTWILGAGFLPLRLVSVLATVVTLIAIAVIGRHRGGWTAGIAGGAVYAGSYRLSDGWFDLARVDALYVALLAVTWWLAARAIKPRDWMLAGAAGFLAVMTKQPALIAFIPLMILLACTDRRGALCFCVTFLALSALAVVGLSLWTGGWYTYYVFELPRLRLTVSPRSGRVLSFWTADLLPVGIALVMGLAAVVRWREWRHLAIASGLILSAWLARLEGGAWNNAVMPAYLAAAVLLGVALRTGPKRWPLAAAAGIAQLVLLFYDPRPFVPSAAQRADGDAFRAALVTMPAPVWVMDHALWSTAIGGAEHAHGWAVTDVVWADRGTTGRRLEGEIREEIRSGRFGSVVVDDGRSWFLADIERHYQRVREVRAPAPSSGAPRRPQYQYVPRTPARAP